MNHNPKDFDFDEEDDEEGSRTSGSGAGFSMIPRSGGRLNEGRTQDDTGGEVDQDLVGYIPDENDYPRSRDDLINDDDLPNNMVVGSYDGLWYLFDTDGTRYGPFGTIEYAIEVAFRVRSWGLSLG